MTVVIIDYRLGNVRSVANAVNSMGWNVIISNEPADLQSASHLILPGVGAFEDGMRQLKTLGLVDQLSELVLQERKPFLGICLGMQLLAEKGYENGTHSGLGWIPADAVRFTTENHKLKIPHVGWNDVRSMKNNPILGDKDAVRSFYFVHSYYLQCATEETVIGTCDYGTEFTAVIQQDNIFATQFHPEKSHRSGLNLLHNFLSWSSDMQPKAELQQGAVC